MRHRETDQQKENGYETTFTEDYQLGTILVPAFKQLRRRQSKI